MRLIGKIFLVILATFLIVTFGLFQKGMWNQGFALLYTSSDAPRLGSNVAICYPNSKGSVLPNLLINNIRTSIQASQTQDSVAQVAEFYNNLFSQKGYRVIKQVSKQGGVIAATKGDLYQGILLLKDKKSGNTYAFGSSFKGEIPSLQSGWNDSPGEDLKDIPRYPGSSRKLSMDLGGFNSKMLAYKNKGSFISNADFYKTAMVNNGWSLNPVFEKVRGRYPKLGKTLFFQKGDKECFISFSRDKKENVTWITIVQMPKKGGN